MGKYIHICVKCGKEFENYNKTGKFCSRMCYEAFRQDNRKYKKIKCLVCGKEFQQERENHMFCSVECRIKFTEDKIECICDNCGGVFERKRSEVDKNKRHYCSKECMRLGMYWSNEDTQILRDNFGKFSYSEMTELFSEYKDVDTIKRRAIYIGLTSSQEWSLEEKQILLENYSTKSIKEVLRLLPNRSRSAILGQARSLNIKSFFYINHLYSDEENQFLKENYLTMTNAELGEKLNREPNGVAQHLWVLGLSRPLEINNYKNLYSYVRQRNVPWRDKIRMDHNFVCELTGKRSNVVVHHIHGFILLFNEVIDMLDFPLYDDMSRYTQEQLDQFMDTFFTLQNDYGGYVCINESIHKQFHSIYGYRNNTEEQWEEFVNKYYQ